MIHIHGTPISGTNVGAFNFLKGRHGLVSFARPDQLSIVQDACATYVLDNGAFTTWKQGKDFDVAGYINWVSSMKDDPKLQWALIPDVIDGNEEDNNELINLWLKTGVAVCGVPVWHMHESINRLKSLCQQFERVAIGSSGEYPEPGTNRWWQRMGQAMNEICVDGRPPCKLHGLRMLDPRIFTHLPLSSADSTNAAQNGCTTAKRLGLPYTWQGCTVIAWKIEANQSLDRWENSPEQVVI